MAMWHPSMYGWSSSGYEQVTPLANKPYDQWWFHGYANNRPSEVLPVHAGQDLKVEIACSKSYTSWGNSKQGNDACPGDAGAYHAGGSTGSASAWGGNSEENLTGCAFAIAYKSDAKDVKMEDFIVMSVQENCVRWRDTTFSIPANLPNCPNGECTCAWFWQGKNSAAEMYMNGFRCQVVGGANTTPPAPKEPRRGSTISGPTQPMYWANSPSNIGYNPTYDNRPTYNSKFGWQNGAQTSAFAGLASGGNGGAVSASSASSAPSASSASASSSESSSSRTRSRRPQGTDVPTSSIGNQYNAEPPVASASSSAADAVVPSSGSEYQSESASPVPSPTGDAAVSPTVAPTYRPSKGKHCKRRSRAHLAAGLS